MLRPHLVLRSVHFQCFWLHGAEVGRCDPDVRRLIETRTLPLKSKNCLIYSFVQSIEESLLFSFFSCFFFLILYHWIKENECKWDSHIPLKETDGGSVEYESQRKESSLRWEEPVSSKKRSYCSGASAVSRLLTWTMCTGEKGSCTDCTDWSYTPVAGKSTVNNQGEVRHSELFEGILYTHRTSRVWLLGFRYIFYCISSGLCNLQYKLAYSLVL